MRKRVLFFLSILVMLMLACNLASAGSPTQAPGSTSQAPGDTPQGGGNQPGGILQPAGTPDADPVSINNGLASLNSYLMTVSFKSVDPDPTKSSTITVATEHSKGTATHTHYTMAGVSVGGGDPQTSESDMYDIGNERCSGSGEDWTWTSSTPEQAEILDLFKSMLGLTPLIDNPTFVAEETVNGIPSNHFTFKAPGLGVTSGANVTINQGDYWLAKDGQYIVKYMLIIEESTDPQSVIHEEISIDLTQINQPVSIAFPQACLDAKAAATPTP
jgi:hypothetical protein